MIRGDHRARRVARDRLPRARDLRELRRAGAKAAEEDEEVPTELSRGQLIFAFAIAIGFAVVLFKVTPALITNWLPIHDTGGFVVVEGAIRVTLFVAYLALISLLPDLRRVFQYHAAEHKAINAYEAGDELTPENVQRHSLIHVRCGTAFLLWVMVIAIFVFAFFGRPDWYWLIVTRILLLPVIAGPRLRADPLRRQARGQPVVRALLAPGLWLQRLTTRQPSLDQLEVSIRALQEVLEREEATRGQPWRTSGGDGLMATDRTAQVTWNGSLMDGSGTITSTTSGAIGEQPVSWASRAEDAGRQDEPRGADRGRACRVLLDGALARARAGRHTAGGAQDLGDRDVPAR